MSSNDVRLKVRKVRDGKAVIESGAYQITFREGSNGKAQITSVFFISTGSYIDKDDVPYEYAHPARIRANVVFRDHQQRRHRKTKAKEKDRGSLQLTFPGM